MALNPNIALGVRPLEVPNQLAQYAQLSQIQNAQQANRLNEMQMAEYERARLEEEGTRNFLGKADLTDPNVRTQLLTKYGKAGREIFKNLSEAEKAQSEDLARQAKLAQDTQAMYQNISGIISNKADAAKFLQLVVNDPAMKDSPLAKIPLMQQVARIPEDPAGLDDWKKQFALGATKYITENKPSTQAINRSGQTDIVQTPGLGGVPKTVGTYADVPLPANVLAQKKEIARAGASNVTLSTERKYGDRFGGLIAESDAAKLAAAENAPRMAENADRITDLLATGKVITGTGANVRLQIAKALNLAGGTDSERIKNTEVLVSSLAETTLGAIKASNLGAGQGFTNADRDFLEKAVAGQLSYDQKSLGELARLSRKAAEKSAEAWNKRAPNIPKSALEGTGYSTEPVIVPPRKVSSVMNIPADAIEMLKNGTGTREQFDAQFGPGSADRVLPKGK
jgi:hypothetical protein